MQRLPLPQRAFTLIELLISGSLSAIILGSTAYVGIQSYIQFLSRTDVDTIVTAALHAHAESINGVCDSKCLTGPTHGVHVTPAEAIVFQGNSYADRNTSEDEFFPLSGNSKLSGESEIIFAPLTGITNSTSTITVNRSGATQREVFIYPNGVIDTRL